MLKINGLALLLIGLLHSLIGIAMPGLVGFEGIWQDVAAVGIVDAAKPEALPIWGYYWFLVSGFLVASQAGVTLPD